MRADRCPCAGARWRAPSAHRRSRRTWPRGSVGHVRAHGHAALAQAPHRARPRISLPDLSCLVRSAARRGRMAAAVQDRHQGLAGLPAVGARHGWTCGRERHGGHASRSRPNERARRAARTSRPRDRIRAKGRSCGRPRRIGRCIPAGFSIVGSGSRARNRSSVPLVGSHRLRALQGRQGRHSRRRRLSLRQCRRRPGDGRRKGLPVRAATALPQVNKSKWIVFPGFFLGYRELDDATRWQIYTYIFSEGVPPPHESVLRCDRHAGFAIQFDEPWLDVIAHAHRHHGRHREGAPFLRCGNHGHGILSRPCAAARAGGLPRQDIAVGRSRIAAGRASPSRGRALPLSRARLRAARAGAGSNAGPLRISTYSMRARR